MNINIQTKRLILRSAITADADDLAKKRSTPFVLKHNLYMPCSGEQILSELDYYPLICLVKKDDNQLIGALSIREDLFRYHVNAVELQFWLSENFSNKGYMTEAISSMIDYIFTSTSAEIISIKAFDKNIASLRLAKKLGFLEEGYLRHAVKNGNGEVFDLVLFSLSKNDYIEKFNR